MLKTAITSCEQCGNEYAYYWLKSIKNRVAPQQAMWSEEDINHCKDAILAIQEYRADCIKKYGKDPVWADCVDWLKDLKDRVLPQPKEWSEEEKKILSDIIIFVSGYSMPEVNKKWISFLKSLRPQKPEWSEEDKNLREATIGLLNLVQPHDAKSWGKSRYDCIDWLRNLRPKNNAYHEGFKNGFAKARGMGYKQWKPSDEQMDALDFAADCIVPAEFCFKRKELKGLLEQLKKLKG